ncbi:sugar-dependent 1-like [Striga asiatica]|uniref:Sugar-dependent 1-like n=1 Tax=Striga asiatica TaxID=4170 RepID=A0A5A7R3W6_STRAF|nr:sugar-dependent 1-like [Striga asiatica]
MKKVFGFNLVGKRSKPADFNAKKSWTELSLHTSWDPRGMPNGLIQDLATTVVHRFIGVKVCSMTFLQDSLQDIALNQRAIPALSHVVTHRLNISESLLNPSLLTQRGRWRALQCDALTSMSSNRPISFRTEPPLRSIRSVRLTTPISRKSKAMRRLTLIRPGHPGNHRMMTSMSRCI